MPYSKLIPVLIVGNSELGVSVEKKTAYKKV